MTKKELNGLGNPYVDVCSIAVSFAAAHRRQTKLANQTDKMQHKETRPDALLLDTTVVRVPLAFPYKRKRVRRIVSEILTSTGGGCVCDAGATPAVSGRAAVRDCAAVTWRMDGGCDALE